MPPHSPASSANNEPLLTLDDTAKEPSTPQTGNETVRLIGVAGSDGGLPAEVEDIMISCRDVLSLDSTHPAYLSEEAMLVLYKTGIERGDADGKRAMRSIVKASEEQVAAATTAALCAGNLNLFIIIS